MLIDSSNAAVNGLADAADGLAPAEVLFDALADRLADGVAAVSRRASIDRAATDARGVVRDARRHAPIAASGDEVTRVVSLVAASVLGCVPGTVSIIVSAAARSP